MKSHVYLTKHLSFAGSEEDFDMIQTLSEILNISRSSLLRLLIKEAYSQVLETRILDLNLESIQTIKEGIEEHG